MCIRDSVTGAKGLPSNLKVKQVGKVLRGVFRDWDGDAFCRYAEKFALPSEKKVSELSSGMKDVYKRQHLLNKKILTYFAG